MKRSNILIAVDSDGTAFDTMNLKHLSAQIPAALEVWGLKGALAARYTAIAKQVNLYSSHRGDNRFPCLLEVFTQLKREFPEDENLPDLTPLQDYLAGVSTYANESLQAWMQKHPSFELAKVLNWSTRSDVLFEKARKGVLPFAGVKEALTAAHEQAAVVVVSTAQRESLDRDWLFGGLTPHVDWILGQEEGSEAEQLRKAMAQCEPDVRVLMLGDTENDRESVHAVGGRFFPVVPGKEEECWKAFQEDVLGQFLDGVYGDEEEDALYQAYKEIMK